MNKPLNKFHLTKLNIVLFRTLSHIHTENRKEKAKTMKAFAKNKQQKEK